jgi:hypothetical protein
MAALAPEWRGGSMAHVEARGQFPRSGRFQTEDAHGACLA